MKETDFIEKNKKKWQEFEKISQNKSKDPDKLSELFVEITEDLSYAKTFYPKRSVRVYLNYLAQKVFLTFSKSKTSFRETFVLFWKKNLPLEMYRSRKAFLTSFLFFFVAVLVGAVSSYIDPDFSRIILGDYYVDMTMENINKGDPMAVYKQMNEGEMFLEITINNIRVAFLVFIMGVFFSVGSAFLLVSNGFMLGAFQYFFYIKGLLLTSFLVIWIHGTLEISAIVIAGAAGIVMGNGLLFPGTLTRTQSLQIHAKRGINILLGTVPLFVVAGFLEGYVTRHTEMPNFVKGLIIFSSLAFIVGYFVIYPFRVGKKFVEEERVEERPIHTQSRTLSLYSIRTMSQVFYDTFRFYKLYLGRIASVIFFILSPLAFLYLVGVFSISPYGDYYLEPGELFELAFGNSIHFSWAAFAANALFFTLTTATVIHCMQLIKEKKKGNYLRLWVKEIWPMLIKAFPLVLFFLGVLFLVPKGFYLFLLLASPFFVLVVYPVVSGETSFQKSLSRGISYGSKDFWGTLVSFLLISVLAYVFSWMYYNSFLPGLDLKSLVIDEIIDWHTITVFEEFLLIKNFISAFLILIIAHLLLPLIVAAVSFQYLSIHDKQNALGLKQRLKKFGKGNKHFETKL
jgi:uncharacterized membrane protein SpoIIM required for sporulation